MFPRGVPAVLLRGQHEAKPATVVAIIPYWSPGPDARLYRDVFSDVLPPRTFLALHLLLLVAAWISRKERASLSLCTTRA